MKENQYMLLKQEIEEKHNTYAKNRPFIMAIDGLSGAGKTTLLRNLQHTFTNEVVMIHIDDYIEEKAKRYHTGYEEWYEYYQLQWNVEKIKESFFEKIHQNKKELYLPYYDWEKDKIIPKLVKISSASIVIIEGVFLLREEWKHYYDYVIFLDCPETIRRERSVHRDQYIGDLEDRLKKYENRYWPAEAYYMEKIEPLKYAHCIWKYNEDGEIVIKQ